MVQKYNDPAGGTDSSIGKQLADFWFQKKAIIEVAKEQYFSQLADTTAMPKHMGKTIKRFQYIPMLDDANINDQGIDASGATIANGNLYGSSKDIGTIPGKLPMLTEDGGRVNRVGFKRKTLEGSIDKLGYFSEYTQESLDFDSDEELQTHINREMLFAANEITEDMLQIDLLNAAGVVRYAGSATSNATVDSTSVVTYKDLMDVDITLTNNRTPKKTTVITGSRMVDTKVIPAARVAYIGSELIPTIKGMADTFNNPAFIPVEKYAAAGTILNGEIGAVDSTRFVVVPEMMNWTGAGAALGGNADFHDNGTNFNVYPILIVGDQSFTTIGFQTNGKSVKFTVYHKAPCEANADRDDPYGDFGFMSIKWYYGFMALRPERIALIKTAARL